MYTGQEVGMRHEDSAPYQTLKQALQEVDAALLWTSNTLSEIDTAIKAREQALQALRVHRERVAAELEALNGSRPNSCRRCGAAADEWRGISR
jgi:hypothetical protein